MVMTCAEKLADAEAALHRLQTGTSATTVWDGDFRAEYTKANISDLTAYINRLLAECGPDAGLPCTGRHPIRFRMT